MRHRRAERCVMRAEAALEAGLEDEAHAALAEARALNPHAPDFGAVSASVRQRRLAALAAAKRARIRRTTAVAVLAAAVVSGALALWVGSSGSAENESGAPAFVANTPSPAQPPQTAAQPPSTFTPAPPAAVTTPPSGAPAVTTRSSGAAAESPVRMTGSAERASAEVPPPATPPVSTLAVSTREAPAPEPSLPSVQEVNASVPLTRAPSTQSDTAASARTVPPTREPDALVRELPSAALPAVSTPPPPASPPAAEPAPPSDESRVRAVLARFEAAYSTLDASAARSVWPSVDERSLERAFNSLESQHVSLGRCSIVLSGVTAQAECSGTASWTPKVGGGRRTEARQWQFDLASANGAWQIVRATAR